MKLNTPKTTELILGIDPGTRYLGYGLIKTTGGALDLVAAGRFSPVAAWTLARRLAYIYQGLYDLASGHRPQSVAVEDIFHAQNARAALRLGHARGVAFLVAAQVEADVFEYAPNQVKSAVAGYGKAAKTQVAHMVKELLGYQGETSVDATDALAVAICHAGQMRLNTLLPIKPGRSGRGGGWRGLSQDDLAALSYNGKDKQP